MNINELFAKKPEDNLYATSIRRSTATMIDMWIVLFLRMLVMQLLSTIWLNQVVMNFMDEFYTEFGTELIKNNPDHINFLIHHQVFSSALIFYAIIIMVGAFYHAYLNSSRWQATLGKRIMKIIIEKEDGSKLKFRTGLAHYFLSVLPFVYIFYLLTFQMKNHLTFYQAVTYSEFNVFLGLVFIAWVQIHLFTKKKSTAYDMICKTVFVKGRTQSKLPWKQKKNNN